MELGQQVSTLDSIEAKYGGDTPKCFRQVLKEWLKGVNPPPTWQAMANALKKPTVGQYYVAEQVQTKLLSRQPLLPQPESPQSLSLQYLSPLTSAEPHPKSLGLYCYWSAIRIEFPQNTI